MRIALGTVVLSVASAIFAWRLPNVFPSVPEWVSTWLFIASAIGMIVGFWLLIPAKKSGNKDDPPAKHGGVRVTMGNGNIVGDISSNVSVKNVRDR